MRARSSGHAEPSDIVIGRAPARTIAGPACRTGTGCRTGRRAPETRRDREALAPEATTWHAAPMQNSHQSPRAGGAAIALLALAGVGIGNHYGQASIGLLAGLAIGTAIALALWLLDRRRG